MANTGSIENLADVHATLHRRAGEVRVWMVNIARGTYQLERVRFDALASDVLVVRRKTAAPFLTGAIADEPRSLNNLT